MDNQTDNLELISIVIGFDEREAVNYHVFCQSILAKSSRPISFIPLARTTLPGYREIHRDGSNHFTYTRFLTPYLLNYRGWAIYADGDMVCLDDIYKLWALRDRDKAVQVVKHNYLTTATVKYFNQRNENYPRKNWSSVILWNCEHERNRVLTPSFVSEKTGKFLHRFAWLNDNLIGEIPTIWNWLASEYEDKEDASLVHYTLGSPCFSQFSDCNMASYWHDIFRDTMRGVGQKSFDRLRPEA